MSLRDEVLNAVNNEITNDPTGVGYDGKSPDDIAVLLNNPVYRTSVIGYEDIAPISRILTNIPGPNVVTSDDIVNIQLLAANQAVTITAL